MDIIRWSDLLSSNTCFSSGIARLSGPIRDRADRVTQVCHLERIVPEARSPNWPYGRLDRAPLSVPLVTTRGAPRRGAKTTCERWQDRSVASDDRDPLADNPPFTKGQQHEDMKMTIRRTPHHGANPPGDRDPWTGSWPRHAIPGESLGPAWRAGDPARDCRVAVVPNTLEEPGRRIGQRGDATRAPTQGPRPGWAAGSRPSASRDWPQCDKSINSPPTAAISPPPPCHPPT